MSTNPVFEVSQKVLQLTQDDQIMWSHDTCYDYTATYQGMILRLRCNFREALFIVNDDRYNIGRDAVIDVECLPVAESKAKSTAAQRLAALIALYARKTIKE